MFEHRLSGRDVADEEGPEFGVASAGFVKPHFVDDVFEVFGVGSPEGDAPFPVVQSETDGNQLADFAGEGHAAAGVFAHQGVALVFGEREPVFADFALLVHRVEASVGVLGKRRGQPLLVHADETGGVAFDFFGVGRAVGGFTFGEEPLAKLLDAGDVFANLGHRDKRVAGRQRNAKRARHQPLMYAVDLERVGVHQHQAKIGFVAADDRSLHAERGVVVAGIKCRDHVGSAGGHYFRRQAGEHAAVPRVVKMAAMPTALGGSKRNFRRLGSVCGTIHGGFVAFPKGDAKYRNQSAW